MRQTRGAPKVFNTLMVAQPSAQLIADGFKDIENRSKNCLIRGFVALYATKSRRNDSFEYWNSKGYTYHPDKVPYGKILGFCEIVDVITSRRRNGYRGDWLGRGVNGIWVKNVIKLKEPVPARFPYGTINWGKLKGPALKKCLAQLTPAQRKKLSR